jgi:hypothetical protein
VFKGSPAHVSALSGPAITAWYPASYVSAIGGGPATRPRVSCRLSTTGIGLLGILFPPRVSALLTVGLPGECQSIRPDPDGVSTFHTPESRPDWVPSLPRDHAVLSGRSDPSDRRAPPLPGARSYRPGPHPISRSCLLRGVVKGSLAFTRPAFSLARSSLDGTRTTLGTLPGLRTPQTRGSAEHAEAGDGHRALARSYRTTDIAAPPSQ